MDTRSDEARLKFFGRRKGRSLKASQQVILDERLPAYLLDPAAIPKNPKDLFSPVVDSLQMEIGFGSGEHLVAQAQANPTVGYIGCEPFINGVVKLVRDLDKAKVSTVRVYPDDARHVLDVLPDGCLDQVFVLFPDPWPKARHRMRRFIGPDNMPRLARVIRPGGRLRCATDHPDYLEWMLVHAGGHSDFTWTAERPGDWLDRPSDQPPTRYETKALAGRPHYLSFLRRD
ncbi:MAG: tRNA (guanine(46)-N(7))-methyltransferase TrmB [Alphaproteobacteria bacterium]|nr:tRNA (guanine(46)-N(7))-methyltransferase TrmB [Alphaproteobacteria bacterium]